MERSKISTAIAHIPAWVDGAEIKINGEATGVEAKAGSYAVVERE